ncbi:hypothetical protein INQ51_02990 [Maribellus sp. CM-23]|uniref:DUF1292 domain-containing protein n=1 Tax=Maribellus luteus TaxID=2305463 RepID=A0A399T0D3_9BACT|nr:MULTISPECIES: hypothetical protein [Maribellus]MCE4563266.1 hypothetical protein [Maribellus sp. CM-23]RIJ47443.1 hypothetical protein D1614_15150 [Maribellus luteus]
MTISKPRVIKDYNKLDKELQQQIKLIYADGFADNLIHFFDKNGQKITVLPFETEDKYYMLRMTENEAVALVDEDDDYDDEGFLKDEVKQEYEDKYSELDHIADKLNDDEDIPDDDDDDDDDGGDDEGDDDDF